ncbi:MAG: Clp1/GlmU family protein [candidate division KSB1 bacterium]|nr:Clp1/GlmU family protein [candidate division KSB1 bacterium]
MSETPETWKALLQAAHQSQRPTMIYVLGAIDTGKSTLCRFLHDHLQRHSAVAYIDCDPGQSTIGPPTTVGMTLQHRGRELLQAPLLRFVGSTTPLGHLLPMLTGILRLAEKATAFQADYLILDSSGFCLGRAAQEFQIHLLDLLHPAHIVALQRGQELEPILANFHRHPRMQIHRLPVSQSVVPRMPPQRRSYREDRFRSYFAHARSYRLSTDNLGLHGRIPAADPMNSRDLLIGLCDREHFLLALGIVQQIDWPILQIQFLAPPFPVDKTAVVHFGSIHLDVSGVQLMGQRNTLHGGRSRYSMATVPRREPEEKKTPSAKHPPAERKSHDARVPVSGKKSARHFGSASDERGGSRAAD